MDDTHCRRKQQGEFIAAPTRQEHARRNARLQLFGNGLQHPITHEMAERVVDFLEPVEIDQRDRHRLLLGALHRGGQSPVEGGAIIKAGQPVAFRRSPKGNRAKMFLGAIENDPCHTVRMPIDVHPLAHHADAAPLTIGPADAGFEHELRTVGNGLAHGRCDGGPVLGFVECERLLGGNIAALFKAVDRIDLIRPMELRCSDIHPPAPDLDGALGLPKQLA